MAKGEIPGKQQLGSRGRTWGMAEVSSVMAALPVRVSITAQRSTTASAQASALSMAASVAGQLLLLLLTCRLGSSAAMSDCLWAVHCSASSSQALCRACMAGVPAQDESLLIHSASCRCTASHSRAAMEIPLLDTDCRLRDVASATRREHLTGTQQLPRSLRLGARCAQPAAQQRCCTASPRWRPPAALHSCRHSHLRELLRPLLLGRHIVMGSAPEPILAFTV